MSEPTARARFVVAMRDILSLTMKLRIEAAVRQAAEAFADTECGAWPCSAEPNNPALVCTKALHDHKEKCHATLLKEILR